VRRDKLEARNPKFETNSKHDNINQLQCSKRGWNGFGVLDFPGSRFI
jgi:hypothetical protein